MGSGDKVLQVATGYKHSCALLNDGTVKCWGYNEQGQLGLGDTADRGDQPGEMGVELPPVLLGTNAQVAEITAGREFSCARLRGGAIKCWGSSTNGELGLGDAQTRGDGPGEMGDALPSVDLGHVPPAIQLSAGSHHTCALLASGQVKCWGSGRGTNKSRMGDALPTVKLGAGRAARQVSAGSYHTCAVLRDGDIECWGDNMNGQLGLGDKIARDSLLGDKGASLVPVQLGTSATATYVGAGDYRTCAVLANGTAKCWGAGVYGALGLGDQEDRGDRSGEMGDRLPAIFLGSSRVAQGVETASCTFTCALLDDGNIKCWGAGDRGSLGQGNPSYAGYAPGQMELLPPVALGVGRTAVQLDVGCYHACALLDEGSVKCWGWNEWGQLGRGDKSNQGDGPGEMGDLLQPVPL